MCKGANSNASGGAIQPFSAWLAAVGPRISAGYAAMPLPVVVEAVLAELTSAGLSFTAYDVTTILRALFPHPQRELPHYDRHGAPGVQPEVHRQMADYLLGGAYSVKVVYPNGVDPAHLYAPVKRRRRGLRWLNLLPVSGSATTATTATAATTATTASALPVRAWVIKDTSC